MKKYFQSSVFCVGGEKNSFRVKRDLRISPHVVNTTWGPGRETINYELFSSSSINIRHWLVLLVLVLVLVLVLMA